MMRFESYTIVALKHLAIGLCLQGSRKIIKWMVRDRIFDHEDPFKCRMSGWTSLDFRLSARGGTKLYDVDRKMKITTNKTLFEQGE